VTSVAQTLWELERQLWLRAGDVDFYREKLAEDAVMVFPAPFGIVDRGGILEAIASATDWEAVTLDDRRLLLLSESSAVLAYRGSGRRPAGAYETYATSVYAVRAGAWKLALHQQTPIPQADA
jgi:hypothetical protein